MLMDRLFTFTPLAGQTITASAASGYWMDFVVTTKKLIGGSAKNLRAVVNVLSISGTPTLIATFRGATATDLSTGAVDLGTSGAAQSVTAGQQIVFGLGAQATATRYYGFYFTFGSSTNCVVTAELVEAAQENGVY
jgi:hypothetical protein